MNNTNITEDNFLMYAMKAYDSPNLIMCEFEEDMRRFSYLNRLFTRYVKYGDLKERLIINHLVILNNVFGTDDVVKMLFFKIQEEYHDVLKTFLLFLNIMKDHIYGVNGRTIISSDMGVDVTIVKVLRKIK